MEHLLCGALLEEHGPRFIEPAAHRAVPGRNSRRSAGAAPPVAQTAAAPEQPAAGGSNATSLIGPHPQIRRVLSHPLARWRRRIRRIALHVPGG